MRFFLNPESTAYLRELAAEFGVSSNGVREELRHMESRHTHCSAKRRAGRSTSGPISLIPCSLISKLWSIRPWALIRYWKASLIAWATWRQHIFDDYALGRDTGIIDILLVGEIDPYHLTDLTRKTERYIERKIRTLVFSREEFERLGPEMLKRPHLRLWG